MQELANLPDSLVTRVFSSSDCSLDEHLAVAPQRIHDLALHATFPSILATKSLSLDCSLCSVTSAAAALALFAHVPEGAHLHVSQFPSNNIQPLVGSMSNAFTKSLRSLRITDSNNYFKDTWTGVVNALVRHSAALAGLTTLQVECNVVRSVLGEKGAISLGGALASFGQLQELWLSGNHIGNGGQDTGVAALCRGLVALKELRCLGLSSNQIGDKGAAALAASLAASTKLQELNLENNLITGESKSPSQPTRFHVSRSMSVWC